MKARTLDLTMISLIILILTVSCAISDQRPILPTNTSSTLEKTITPLLITAAPSFTPTSTNRHTVTSIQTSTPTIRLTTPMPSWTSLPTLPPDEAKRLVGYLLENNAGYRLPCWWGFMPGQTSWTEANQFLSQIALHIGIGAEISKNYFFASVKIPSPPSQMESSQDNIIYLSQDYLIKDGIIETIKVYNYDLVPAYYLPAFLEVYGQPSGIWIRTFREEERNSQPFLLDIFYSDQGILLEYSGGILEDIGDELRNCLEGMNSPFIYLWSLDYKMTFDEAKDRFLDTINLPQPVPLRDATGMDVITFFKSVLNSDTVCIETPKKIWP